MPFVAVALTGELTGLAGGAAVMKTLAVAGAVVGGGAVAGIAVVAVGSAAVAVGVTKLLKRVRRAEGTTESMETALSDQIEIYVRDSGDRTLLNVFVPSRMREQLIAAIQHGSFSGGRVPITLEMPILDKWVTEDGQARDDEIGSEPVHVRVPITGISVHFTE